MTKIEDKPDTDAGIACTWQVQSILGGLSHDLQGAILADLLAIWLAAFPGERELQRDLLGNHIATVRLLIPINEALLLAREHSREKPV
jgi:hypothetical protein